MRVFISWSGDRSGHIAKGLKKWLEDVLQALRPWVSSEDIDKGAHWNHELARELQTTSVGIVCLTPENVMSPWILFEAGALANHVESSRVCTYLYEVQPTDLQGPLAAFQATESTKTDTLRLLKLLNRLIDGGGKTDPQVERAFERWWPDLERVLHSVPQRPTNTGHHRSDRQLLEEVLTAVRRQERITARGESRFDGPVPEHFEPLLRLEHRDVAKLKNNLRKPDPRVGELKPAQHIASLDRKTPSGHWVSEWTGGAAGEGVLKGKAQLTFDSDWMVAIEAEVSHRGPYLLIAKRDEDQLFVGRSVVLKTLRHSTTWVGQIVSETRVRGQWALGRWDFVRST